MLISDQMRGDLDLAIGIEEALDFMGRIPHATAGQFIQCVKDSFKAKNLRYWVAAEHLIKECAGSRRKAFNAVNCALHFHRINRED